MVCSSCSAVRCTSASEGLQPLAIRSPSVLPSTSSCRDSSCQCVKRCVACSSAAGADVSVWCNPPAVQQLPTYVCPATVSERRVGGCMRTVVQLVFAGPASSQTSDMRPSRSQVSLVALGRGGREAGEKDQRQFGKVILKRP